MDRKTSMLEAFQKWPVMPSLRREEQLSLVASSPCGVVLVSSGSIFTICDYIERLHREGKMVLVHIDLINGLGRDAAGVRFLKEKAKVEGIVTPQCSLAVAARKEGLIAVHRVFAYDSVSLETGMRVLQQSKADFVEVLPGAVVPAVVGVLRQQFDQPVIAGGLIRTREEVEEVMKAGAVAVDTSAEHLWGIGAH